MLFNLGSSKLFSQRIDNSGKKNVKFKTYLNFAVFFIVVAIIIRKFTANNCFFDKGFGSFCWSLGISISWLLFFVFLLLKLVKE